MCFSLKYKNIPKGLSMYHLKNKQFIGLVFHDFVLCLSSQHHLWPNQTASSSLTRPRCFTLSCIIARGIYSVRMFFPSCFVSLNQLLIHSLLLLCETIWLQSQMLYLLCSPISWIALYFSTCHTMLRSFVYLFISLLH